MASDPYAWRLPQRVIELRHFEYPAPRQRSVFDGDKIEGDQDEMGNRK